MIVIDMNSGENAWAGNDADVLDWFRAHGIEPKDTHRVEIDLGKNLIHVCQYATNEDGKHYTEKDAAGQVSIAMKSPWDQPINLNQIMPDAIERLKNAEAFRG